jgi:hypothetical protein
MDSGPATGLRSDESSCGVLQLVQLWVLAAVLFSPVRVGPYAIAEVGFLANGITMYSKVGSMAWHSFMTKTSGEFGIRFLKYTVISKCAFPQPLPLSSFARAARCATVARLLWAGICDLEV